MIREPLVALLVNADLNAGLVIHLNLRPAVVVERQELDGVGRLIHTLAHLLHHLHLDHKVPLPPHPLRGGTFLALTWTPANMKMPQGAFPATPLRAL